MCPGFPEDTSQCERISALLSRVGDKWTVQVVRVLGTGPMRFNALRRSIGEISQKMLSTTLRNLERDGFVTRTRDADQPAAGGICADRARREPARAGAGAGRLDGGQRREDRGGAAGLRRAG